MRPTTSPCSAYVAKALNTQPAEVAHLGGGGTGWGRAQVAKEKLSRRKALEFGLALAQGNHGASLLDLDQIKAALDIEMAQGEWDILGRLRRLVEDEATAEGGEDDRAEESEED